MKCDINLVIKRHKIIKFYDIVNISIIVLLVSAFIFYGIVQPLRYKQELEKALMSSIDENKDFEQLQNTHVELEAYREEREQRMTAIDKALGDDRRITQILNHVKDNLPDGLGLLDFSYDSNGLNLTGETPSNTKVAMYAIKLRESDLFQTVSIKSIGKESEIDNIKIFHIECKFPFYNKENEDMNNGNLVGEKMEEIKNEGIREVNLVSENIRMEVVE